MNAFSNNIIKDKLCGGCDCSGFAPAVSFSLAGDTLTLTDATVYPSGDSRKVVRFRISDRNGKGVIASIAAGDADNATTADLATLDSSEGYTIQATVVTAKGCLSDGTFFHLGIHATEGNLGGWDKDNDAVTV